MVRRRWSVGIAASVAALSMMFVGADSALAAYSTERSVSSADWNASWPTVGVDREGDALMVWCEVSTSYPYTTRLRARTMSRSGELGSVIQLSPSGQPPSSPQVALDDDGDAVVVWHGSTADTDRIYARRVSRTGVVGPVQAISASTSEALFANVAIDPDGDAVVTWSERPAPDGLRHPMVRRIARDNRLGPIVQLSARPRQPVETPSVAVDRQGDALIAWAEQDAVYSRVMNAAGTLSPVRTVSPRISPLDGHSGAAVAVDRYGNGVVVWRRWDDAALTQAAWSRQVKPTGELGTLRRLSSLTYGVSNLKVASDLEGDIVVAWDRGDLGSIYARRISRTDTLGPTVTIGTGRLTDIELDDDGDGVAVWEGPPDVYASYGTIRSTRIGRSGTFGSATVISRVGEFPQVDVSASGRAVVAWVRPFTSIRRIQVSTGP